MDTTAKAADRLGIGTEELVGLQHAANLAGISSDQLGMALNKMLLNTGSASAEQLGVVADRIAAMEDPSKRAAEAVKIFGRSGMQLLPLLLGGSAGIAAARAEAEQLNLTFSRTDATKVEEANDAFTKLKSAVSGAFQLFVVELAGGVGMAAETAAFKFADIARSGINAFKALRDSVAFFIGSWSLQWELIKVNTAILWDTLKAGAIGSFDAIVAGAVALAKNLVSIYTYIKGTQKALAEGIKAFFAEGFSTDAFNKAFQDNLPSLDLKSVGGAMADGFTQGFAGAIDNSLDAKRKRIIGDIADARKTFDDIKAEAEKTPEVAATAKAALASATVDTTTDAVSNKLADATQFGTSESAQQVFGAISAKAGREDQVAKNTEKTAANTERIAQAIENMEPPDLDVVDSFG